MVTASIEQLAADIVDDSSGEQQVSDASISILLGYSVPLFLLAYFIEDQFVHRYKLRKFEPRTQHADKHTTTEDYLTFLVMCRNLFCVLTILSVPVVSAVWGFQHFLFFLPIGSGFRVAVDPGSAPGEARTMEVMLIMWITVFRSFVAFCFVARFQQHTQCSGAAERPDHALWLSNIPIRDQATLLRHQLTLEDLKDDRSAEKQGQVVQGLRVAINNHLWNMDNGGRREHGRRRESAAVCPLDLTCNCFVTRCTLGITMTCSCCPCLERRLKEKTETPLSQDGNVVGNQQQLGDERHDRIDRVSVTPVMTPYMEVIELYQSIKYADEMVKVYEDLNEKLKQEGEEDKTHTRFKVWSLWWYGNYYALQESRWRDALLHRWELFRDKFQDKGIRELQVSGHAFVEFRNKKDRDEMLEPKREWWETRDHAYFKFGRAPFSSVTLQARKAPHPSDICWENLHIGPCPTVCASGLHISLLILVTAVVVFLIAVSSQLNDLISCTTEEAEEMDWIARLICTVVWAKEGCFAGQVPTVVLLGLNSLILPYWIEYVCKHMHCYTMSRCELNQLALNLIVLMLSKFVVPFISLAILSLLTEGQTTTSEPPMQREVNAVLNMVNIPNDAMVDAGSFYLKYSLNCAFFSTSIWLLQLGRHIYRFFIQCFAKTKTARDEADACFQFSWGYWYAWSLCLAMNGLVTGVMVPSMLPVSAITFALKYYVDSQLLEERMAYNPGPDSKGFFPPYIAHYMYNIIAFKLLFTSILTFQCGSASTDSLTTTPSSTDSQEDLIFGMGKDNVYINLSCLVVFIMSVVLFTVSSWSKLQFRLNTNCSTDQVTCVHRTAEWAVRWWDKFLLQFREADTPYREPLLRRDQRHLTSSSDRSGHGNRTVPQERPAADGNNVATNGSEANGESPPSRLKASSSELCFLKNEDWDGRYNILREVLADKWRNFRGLQAMVNPAVVDKWQSEPLLREGDTEPPLSLAVRSLRAMLCEIFGLDDPRDPRQQRELSRSYMAPLFSRTPCHPYDAINSEERGPRQRGYSLVSHSSRRTPTVELDHEETNGQTCMGFEDDPLTVSITVHGEQEVEFCHGDQPLCSTDDALLLPAAAAARGGGADEHRYDPPPPPRKSSSAETAAAVAASVKDLFPDPVPARPEPRRWQSTSGGTPARSLSAEEEAEAPCQERDDDGDVYEGGEEGHSSVSDAQPETSHPQHGCVDCTVPQVIVYQMDSESEPHRLVHGASETNGSRDLRQPSPLMRHDPSASAESSSWRDDFETHKAASECASPVVAPWPPPDVEEPPISPEGAGEAGRHPPHSSDGDGHDICTPEVALRVITPVSSHSQSSMGVKSLPDLPVTSSSAHSGNRLRPGRETAFPSSSHRSRRSSGKAQTLTVTEGKKVRSAIRRPSNPR